MLRDIFKGTSRDGREDGIRFDRDEFVPLDEDDVRASGFLHVGAGGGIRIQIVREALSVRDDDRVQAHRVVEPGLDVTRSVRCRAVEVRNFQLNRFGAALEIRTYRCGQNTELIFVSRFHADDGVGAEHIRTDVQRRAGTVGRNPALIGFYNLSDGLDKAILRERRHFQPFRGIDHTLRVQVRAEADRTAVLRRIGFQSLEYGLRVLKHSGALGNRDGVV